MYNEEPIQLMDLIHNLFLFVYSFVIRRLRSNDNTYDKFEILVL